MRWRARRRTPCPSCGEANPPDARWCGTCGAPLRARDRTTPDAPADTPAHDGDAAAPDAGTGGRVLAAVLVTALLGGLLVTRAGQEAEVVPAGFTARGDGARTGVVSAADVPAPTGVAWRTSVATPPLLAGGTGVTGTTLLADGTEVVVVADPTPGARRLAVHDVADGALLWTTSLPQEAPPYASSIGAGLVAHRSLTSVSLLDLAARDERWSVERRLRDAMLATSAGVVGVPAETTGIDLVLLAAEDGAEQWRFDGPAGRVLALLETDGVLVVWGEDTEGAPLLLGLDLATGQQTLRLVGEELLGERSQFPSAPLAAFGGRVAVDRDLGVVVVDVRDATTTVVDVGISAVALALDEELLVLGDVGGHLVAVDPATGAETWRSDPVRQPLFGLDLAGDRVLVRSDGDVSLVDRETGVVVGRVLLDPATGAAAGVSTGEVVQLRSDGVLEALDGGGPPRWEVPSVTVHPADMVTDEGRVAVSTPTGVTVHEVADGIRTWEHDAFSEQLVTASSLHAPALFGGRVTISPPDGQAANRGGLLGLFVETGILDWTRDADRVPPRGVPVADRDLLLVPVGSQVLGFDPSRGARRLVVETNIARTDVAAADGWLVAIDAPTDAGDLWVGRRDERRMVFRAPIRVCAPPVVHEDLVLVTDHRGDVLARELATGDQPWGERTGGVACRPLTVVGDTLVALVDDRVLLGIGLDDGETSWRVELPAHAAGAPVAAGDDVLVPTLDGFVGAWRVGEDEPRWRLPIDGVPTGAVAVDGSTVLVRTRAGELVALR